VSKHLSRAGNELGGSTGHSDILLGRELFEKAFFFKLAQESRIDELGGARTIRKIHIGKP
jgi:hypothetical protein